MPCGEKILARLPTLEKAISNILMMTGTTMASTIVEFPTVLNHNGQNMASQRLRESLFSHYELFVPISAVGASSRKYRYARKRLLVCHGLCPAEWLAVHCLQAFG